MYVTRCVLMVGLILSAPGCDEEAITAAITGRSFEPPKNEWFILLPRSMPIAASESVVGQLETTLTALPAETWVTILLGDNHEILASFRVPDGVAEMRLDELRTELAAVYERLDPENVGGSQQIDLIGLPASIRSLRKSDQAPRVVVCGSPMVQDPEGNLHIGTEMMPCHGVLLDPTTSWGKMVAFPEGTTATWFLPRADYGNGPNFRGSVEHFLALTFSTKGADLLRVTSDASVAFNATTSQWDSTPTPQDTCNGLKKAPIDEEPEVYDENGDRVVRLGQIEIVEEDPTPNALAGDKKSTVFLIDKSGSVWEDLDGNDVSHRFKGIAGDVSEKLATMPMERFAIIDFGGDSKHRPRIGRYPTTLFGGVKWAEATPANREAAINHVREIRCGGGTPTLAAIEEVLKLGPNVTVILYTDGVPTLGDGGQDAVLGLTELLVATGVTINTVGVGPLSTRDESFDYSGGEFLGRIAHATGGKYFPLDTNKDTSIATK